MKRKIIKLGDTTHVISIPASWFRDHGLSAGDELNVEIKGTDLKISTRNNKKPEKITVQSAGLSKTAIASHLKAAYIKGYEEIEIILEENLGIKTLQDIFSSMIGFEIVEQNKHKILLKDMSYEGEISPLMLMRKCFSMIYSCSEEGLRAVKENKKETLKELKERDFVLNRFINFYLRKINYNSWATEENSKILFSFINLLEKLGDHYANMCSDLSTLNLSLNDETIKIWEYLNKMTETLSTNFFEFNNEAIVMIFDSIHTLSKKIEEQIKNVRDKENLVALGWLKNIGNTISDIALHILLLNI